MLVHRLRRWPNIKPTKRQCLVHVGLVTDIGTVRYSFWLKRARALLMFRVFEPWTRVIGADISSYFHIKDRQGQTPSANPTQCGVKAGTWVSRNQRKASWSIDQWSELWIASCFSLTVTVGLRPSPRPCAIPCLSIGNILKKSEHVHII